MNWYGPIYLYLTITWKRQGNYIKEIASDQMNNSKNFYSLFTLQN